MKTIKMLEAENSKLRRKLAEKAGTRWIVYKFDDPSTYPPYAKEDVLIVVWFGDCPPEVYDIEDARNEREMMLSDGDMWTCLEVPA